MATNYEQALAGRYAPITYQPMQFQPSPTTEDYDIGMANIFGNMPSSVPMQAGPFDPAFNAAQSGDSKARYQQQAFDDVSSGKNYIEDAFNVVEEFNKRLRPRTMQHGIPIPGEPNIRQHMSLSGRPYLTLSTTPTAHYGMSGELIEDKPEVYNKLTPAIHNSELSWNWTGKHSWENQPEDQSEKIASRREAAGITSDMTPDQIRSVLQQRKGFAKMPIGDMSGATVK